MKTTSKQQSDNDDDDDENISTQYQEYVNIL